LSASTWLSMFVVLRRNSRSSLRQLLHAGPRYAVLAGFAIYLSYGLVLISLAFVQNVSYVVAFRQLSIPLGALLGICVLKEAAHTPKILGVIVMFIGLLLVAVG